MNLRSKWVAKFQVRAIVLEMIAVVLASWAAFACLGDEHFNLKVSIYAAVILYLGTNALYCQYGHVVRRYRRTLSDLVRNHRCW